MSIFDAISTLEHELARAKAELLFIRESETFKTGAEYERHRITGMILQRIEALANSGATIESAKIRRDELIRLREIILEAER